MVSYAAMLISPRKKRTGRLWHLHFAAALVLPQDALGIHRGGIATRQRASREQTLVIVIYIYVIVGIKCLMVMN